MKNILILGAGRSTYVLIQYLAEEAQLHEWGVTVADLSQEQLDYTLSETPTVQGCQLDLSDQEATSALIGKHDVVISMLPPPFHPKIARHCLDLKVHLLTASYLSPDMKAYHQEAKEKGLLFLNELGLDPGIDHLSANQVIDHLQDSGAHIHGFHSYAGGLVAPDSDDNPWHYKISWNPLNVVKAGQTWARTRQNGKYKIVPYPQVFKRLVEVEIPGYGTFEGYLNRNALQYQAAYNLSGAHTIVRGTLRRPGFCKSWDMLVHTGLTNDEETIDLEGCTYRDLVEMFLPEYDGSSVREKWARFLGVSPEDPAFQRLEWLGLLEDKPIPKHHTTPALVLNNLLSEKWQMAPGDRDLIVMVHYFDYELNGEHRQRKAYLTLEGKNSQETAMAKTVGLPLALATRLLMLGEIRETGVHIPVKAALYEPLLNALADYGIQFQEEDALIS